MDKKTTVLMILDGYGVSEQSRGNAILEAKTPNLDAMFDKYPWTKGYASGRDVGLPDGQMGNSEVGHLNIGAGRVVYQELTRITKSIEEGDFYSNPEFVQVVEHCKKNDSALHLMGLLSTGGVHSHTEHIYATIRMAQKAGLEKIYVHCFLDGRDTPPSSGKEFVASLEEKIREIGAGAVTSLVGRYYALDRDQRWERVEEAYNTMVVGSPETAVDAVLAVQKAYGDGKTDEFMPPTSVVNEDGSFKGLVNDNDGMIFCNFRPDRAREITRAFIDESFDGFERKKVIKNLNFVCFTRYDATFKNVSIAFKPQSVENTLGEYLANLGKTQLRLAETEKYAHVTFFFNGGVEEPNKGEDRVLVKSPQVATYDLQPEMSADEVTEKLISALEAKKHDLIIVNYANPDMVGHTGIMGAAVKAIESIDKCMEKVLAKIVETGANAFLCADHGNCDKMVEDDSDEAFTAHTTNPVPFVLINYTDGVGIEENGRLADVAPTLLEMMGIPIPEEMTGKSLLIGR